MTDEFSIDVNDPQLFQLGSQIFYRHDAGKVFMIDTGDLGDEDATEAVDAVPETAVPYDPEPSSIEGKAVDGWTESVDAMVAAQGGPRPAMSLSNRSTAAAIGATW